MSLFISIYLCNFGYIRCFIVLSSNPIKRAPSHDVLYSLHPDRAWRWTWVRGSDILDSKIVRNKLYYLVDWLGYSPSERTWEPIDNVTNTRALLEDFHCQYPDKPGPQSKTIRDTRRFKGRIVSWYGKTRTHDVMLHGLNSWPLHHTL